MALVCNTLPHPLHFHQTAASFRERKFTSVKSLHYPASFRRHRHLYLRAVLSLSKASESGDFHQGKPWDGPEFTNAGCGTAVKSSGVLQWENTGQVQTSLKEEKVEVIKVSEDLKAGSEQVSVTEVAVLEGGGGGGNISGGEGGSGGGGGGDNDKGEGEEEEENTKKMLMSQKLSLAYAVLVAGGGIIGYVKSKSRKSLLSGTLSGLALCYVSTQLPVNPVYASSLGLGVSSLLLVVMGTRFKNSGKLFPSGIVSIISLVMTGGYLHGIIRSSHA